MMNQIDNYHGHSSRFSDSAGMGGHGNHMMGSREILINKGIGSQGSGVLLTRPAHGLMRSGRSRQDELTAGRPTNQLGQNNLQHSKALLGGGSNPLRNNFPHRFSSVSNNNY